MTGLEKILEQIDNDAKDAYGQLVSQAEEKAKEIINDANAMIDNKKALLNKEIELETQNIMERSKSSKLLQNRKVLLETKQNLISKTIEMATLELENLETEKYFEVLLKLTEKLEKEKVEISLSEKDKKRMPKEFAEKLPKHITISDKNANINSGFIALYDGIDMNFSFEALFAEKVEELQDISSAILFK